MGGTFERHGGGKSANQAVAAARAGAAVRMIGAVGDDELGAEAIAELEAEGIDVGSVQRLASAPTGVALIAVDAKGENQIAVASGANTELSPEAVEAALAGAAAGGVALIGLEVLDAAVLAGARAARARGSTVVLNPAPARPLPDELLALSPVLTPNGDEACALSGEDEPEAAARALDGAHGRGGRRDGRRRRRAAGRGRDRRAHPRPARRGGRHDRRGRRVQRRARRRLAGGATLADAVRAAVAVAAESVRKPGARG